MKGMGSRGQAWAGDAAHSESLSGILCEGSVARKSFRHYGRCTRIRWAALNAHEIVRSVTDPNNRVSPSSPQSPSSALKAWLGCCTDVRPRHEVGGARAGVFHPGWVGHALQYQRLRPAPLASSTTSAVISSWRIWRSSARRSDPMCSRFPLAASIAVTRASFSAAEGGQRRLADFGEYVFLREAFEQQARRQGAAPGPTAPRRSGESRTAAGSGARWSGLLSRTRSGPSAPPGRPPGRKPSHTARRRSGRPAPEPGLACGTIGDCQTGVIPRSFARTEPRVPSRNRSGVMPPIAPSMRSLKAPAKPCSPQNRIVAVRRGLPFAAARVAGRQGQRLADGAGRSPRRGRAGRAASCGPAARGWPRCHAWRSPRPPADAGSRSAAWFRPAARLTPAGPGVAARARARRRAADHGARGRAFRWPPGRARPVRRGCRARRAVPRGTRAICSDATSSSTPSRRASAQGDLIGQAQRRVLRLRQAARAT